MRNKDDQSVGVSVGWSVKGLTAKIKSRFISSADRLGAQRLDEQGLDIERRVAVHRAMTEAKLSLISAATKSLSAEMKNDQELARRALTVFSQAEQKAENVEICLALALEDLRNRENASTAVEGPDELNPDLVSRWQHYAEGASTEEVRERWGRILASEIRKPGTFSMKTLRVVDELDHATALIFDRFSKRLLDSWAPAIGLDLTSDEVQMLNEAGLIHLPEFPRSVNFRSTKNDNDSEWWIITSADSGVVVRKDAALPGVNRGGLTVDLDDVSIRDGVLRFNVIELTEVGRALYSIVPSNTAAAFRAFANSLRRYGSVEEIKFIRHAEGVGFVDGEDEDIVVSDVDNQTLTALG